MSGPLSIVFFIGITALMIVLIIFGMIGAKKRREALVAFAATRGWTYAQSDDSLVDRFEGSPFGTGQSRAATNCIYGVHDGRQMVAFDYRYQTTSGTGEDRSTTSHNFAVVALSLGVAMPALDVVPEGAVGRFFGRLTNSDIELESEDFNRAFTVKCPDRKFASDVLHPQMMEMLLQWPALAWRLDRDSMLVVRDGSADTQEVDATLAVMDAILDKVPDFVWRDLQGQ